MDGAGPPESALRSISAAVGALADLVQHKELPALHQLARPQVGTSFGPGGKSKLIVNAAVATTTKDCLAIIKSLKLSHPAAKTVADTAGVLRRTVRPLPARCPACLNRVRCRLAMAAHFTYS